MAQVNRGNGRWSLKDLPQFHGKRDGLEHPYSFGNLNIH